MCMSASCKCYASPTDPSLLERRAKLSHTHTHTPTHTHQHTQTQHKHTHTHTHTTLLSPHTHTHTHTHTHRHQDVQIRPSLKLILMTSAISVWRRGLWGRQGGCAEQPEG